MISFVFRFMCMLLGFGNILTEVILFGLIRVVRIVLKYLRFLYARIIGKIVLVT